jgi:hypothetical protein
VTTPVIPRLAALTLAGALTLTGCGGSDAGDASDCGSPKPRTERLTKETAVDALRSAAGLSITQHVTMQVQSSDGSFLMEGDGDSGPDSFTEMDVEMDQGDGRRLRMIYVDEVLYLSGEGLADEGKFLEVDPDDAGDPLAEAMKPALEGTGLADSLTAWEAALVDVRFESDEVLEDGTEAEKYTFLVDAQAALAAQRPGEPLPSGIPTTFVNEVWVDEHNLVRRVEFTLDGARTMVSMSDYCEPIDIEAPDDEDILAR